MLERNSDFAREAASAWSRDLRDFELGALALGNVAHRADEDWLSVGRNRGAANEFAIEPRAVLAFDRRFAAPDSLGSRE